MPGIQVLEFEIKWGVDLDSGIGLFRFRGQLILFGLMSLWHLLWCSRAETLLKHECDLAHVGAVVRVSSFHQNGEVDEVAFGTTAETVEDAPFEIGRERGGIAFAVVIGQRAIAGRPCSRSARLLR